MTETDLEDTMQTTTIRAASILLFLMTAVAITADDRCDAPANSPPPVEICVPQQGATPCSPEGCRLALDNHLKSPPPPPYGWPTLPGSGAADFVSAEPVELEPGKVIYRVFDGNPKSEKGSWWSLNPPPETEALFRAEYAVERSWDSATSYVKATVGDGGLKVWIGDAAAQQAEYAQASCGDQPLPGYILAGGASQVYVAYTDLDQLKFHAPRPTPWTTCLTPEAAGPLTQQMLSLAFTAYLDETFIGHDRCVDQRIKPCFNMALEILPKLEGNWKLVWGPYVSNFHDVIYSDNLLFAVEAKEGSTSRLAIVIRGTNYISLSDWLVEDFEIHRMVEWPRADLQDWPSRDARSCDGKVPRRNRDRSEPRIAEGTCKGLQALLDLPVDREPDEKNIAHYVLTWLAENREKEREIYVTGHSLGGTLTPVLALWLHEWLADKDLGDFNIRMVSFAGLTPGNQAFATRVEKHLGHENIFPIRNPLDLAPYAWTRGFKHIMTTRYLSASPPIKPNVLEDLLLGHWQHVSERNDYAQVNPGFLPLCRTMISPDERTFAKQGFWQHHYGYLYGLDMLNWDDEVCKPCSKSLAKNFCNEADSSSDD